MKRINIMKKIMIVGMMSVLFSLQTYAKDQVCGKIESLSAVGDETQIRIEGQKPYRMSGPAAASIAAIAKVNNAVVCLSNFYNGSVGFGVAKTHAGNLILKDL